MQRHPLPHAVSVSYAHTGTHTQARAYRMYFKSLMCKQLLLFAQTTCSFWTQTKLWRTMGRVNSVGCVGDALHKRSLSTWCRLHQMVGPCRMAASSNRTHTDLKEWSFFSPQHTDMFCFLEKYNFLRRKDSRIADANPCHHIFKRQDGFVYISHSSPALFNICKTAKRWQKWRKK